jgi:hypothetical protein
MNVINNRMPLRRLGFHYFPDTEHYRLSDLQTWLPRLHELGAGWLTLQAPDNRAIPEAFIRGLIDAGITPILQFNLSPANSGQNAPLQLLLKSYADWGVRYVLLFDRPNARRSWPANQWAQSDLVERFLDSYLPLAEICLAAGLIPVFPPLEPGGDYWDTAFLRAALQGIQRRGHDQMLKTLTLSAHAFVREEPLSWGAGGPERWPGARPYFTPPNQENQCGFYIFDWYLTIAEAVLQTRPPIILFSLSEQPHTPLTDPFISGETSNGASPVRLAMARLLAGAEVTDEASQPLPALPPQVLAGNFWVLSADPGSPQTSYAWFLPDGGPLPTAEALRTWLASQSVSPSREDELIQAESRPQGPAIIRHYLLLPLYEWGVADWHLEVIRPFVKKYQVTVGFSLDEAAHANRVTVVGGPQSFPEEKLELLRAAGCAVERVSGDGTSIASTLATL